LERYGSIFNLISRDKKCVGILHTADQASELRANVGKQVVIVGNAVENGCGKELICQENHCGPEMIKFVRVAR
jgi:hypothetical protein